MSNLFEQIKMDEIVGDQLEHLTILVDMDTDEVILKIDDDAEYQSIRLTPFQARHIGILLADIHNTKSLRKKLHDSRKLPVDND